MFETVLFDFDGTLADSLPAVGTAVIKTLEHYGYGGKTLDDVRPFIGPPLKDSFSVYPNVVQNFREAHAYYLEVHRGLLDRYVIYDGIEDLLRALKAAGKTVGVATAKLEQNAVSILQLNGLLDLFDFVAGTVDGVRDSKIDVINHALTLSRGNAVMIGDRHYDINGGKACGTATVGCLWGFGTREELEDCGADYIVAAPRDLIDILWRL